MRSRRFVAGGQVHPQLRHRDLAATLGLFAGMKFLMQQARARRHPLHITRPDGAIVAGAVAMFDLAVIDEGHRLESAMRMGADAGRLRARTERVRRGIVEHQERTHRLPEGQIGEQGENMKAVAHPMRLG